MSKQPEALRLADELDTEHVYGVRQGIVKPAAAELRRLHALNAELLAALDRIAKTPGYGPNGPGAGRGWVHWADQAQDAIEAAAPVQQLPRAA